MDKEAVSIDIVEARTWRMQVQEILERREKEREASQLQDAITWLAVDDCAQEDELDRLSYRRQPGTCDWVLDALKVKSWMEDDTSNPVLWLKGIPGAGSNYRLDIWVEDRWTD